MVNAPYVTVGDYLLLYSPLKLLLLVYHLLLFCPRRQGDQSHGYFQYSICRNVAQDTRVIGVTEIVDVIILLVVELTKES
jgi:hypothetical protein